MFSRTKSVRRLARSVEIITQRPTIGSFLSSGNYGFLSMIAQNLYFTPTKKHRGILRSEGGNGDAYKYTLTISNRPWQDGGSCLTSCQLLYRTGCCMDAGSI